MVAGILTSSAALPQLIKTWKTKDTKDVSLKMFTILVTGIALWVIYGILVSDLPIIATNSLALVLNGVMLYFKVKFG